MVKISEGYLLTERGDALKSPSAWGQRFWQEHAQLGENEDGRPSAAGRGGLMLRCGPSDLPFASIARCRFG